MFCFWYSITMQIEKILTVLPRLTHFLLMLPPRGHFSLGSRFYYTRWDGHSVYFWPLFFHFLLSGISSRCELEKMLTIRNFVLRFPTFIFWRTGNLFVVIPPDPLVFLVSIWFFLIVLLTRVFRDWQVFFFQGGWVLDVFFAFLSRSMLLTFSWDAYLIRCRPCVFCT